MNLETTTSNPGTERRSFLRGEGWIAGLVAFLFFSAYVLSVAIVPIRSDNDCWWHVKTGQYIHEHGIPKNDVFAYTAADHVWNNHEWLSQLGFYHVWQLGEDAGFGGWRAVIIMIAVLLWATYSIAFFLAAKLSRSFWIALLIAVMGVAIGRRMFYPRPPVVSNLIMMGEIALLVAINQRWIRRAWVFALIPVIALWTNLHGGWMAGGMILGAWMLGEVVKRVWAGLWKREDSSAGADDCFPVAWLIVLGIGCLAATFANPFGIELYKLPARVMNDRMLVSMIGELAKPNYFFVIDFLIFYVAIFLMGLATLRRLRPPLWEVLIWLFFLSQAMLHVRHLFLFSVAMVPLSTRVIVASLDAIADTVPIVLHGITTAVQRAFIACIAVYAAAWVIINPREGGEWLHPMTARSYPGRNAQFAEGQGYIRSAFPVLLCDFIEKADLRGNMFNENNYAGYLIWRLSPEKHRVFSDSRFDIFGSKFLAYENVIASGGAAVIDGESVTWESLLERYDVQWAITHGGAGLQVMLSRSKAWKCVARWPADLGGWEVWVRDNAANAEVITRARKAAPSALASAPTD